jgi:SAM-dependent methyltransferase
MAGRGDGSELSGVYWGQQADEWARHAGSSVSDPFFWHVNRQVVEGLLPRSHGVVLDVGAGEGRLSRVAYEAGHTVVALDGSMEMCRLCRANGTMDVLNASVESIPVRSGCVDCVLCIMVLMSIANLDIAISEVSRVLRPGGVAIFVVLHPLVTSGGEVMAGGITIKDYARTRQLPEGTKVRPLGEIRYRHYHRPVSEYLNPMAAKSLQIEKLYEPLPDDVSISARFERWAAMPQSMIWSARKI